MAGGLSLKHVPDHIAFIGLTMTFCHLGVVFDASRSTI
jgi:hypothetical protein